MACSVRGWIGPLEGTTDVVTQVNVVMASVTVGEYAARHPGASGSKAAVRLLQLRGSRPGEAEPASVLNQVVAQSALECETCMCHAVAPRGPSRIHEAQQAVLRWVSEPSIPRSRQWQLDACEAAW